MLASWSIATRIYVGFAIVLALLSGLAIFTFTSMNSVSEVFTRYRSSARDSLAINEMNADLAMARMNALKWRLTPDAAAARAVDDMTTEMLGDLETAAERLDATRAERLRRASGQIAEYDAAFDEAVELQAQRDELVDRMSAIGPDARKNLTEIMTTAYSDNDPEAAFYAGRAQEALLLGRFYSERFLLSNDRAAFDEAQSRMAAGAETLVELTSKLTNPRRRALAQATAELMTQYSATLDEVREVITARNQRFTNTLDRIGPALAAEYGAVVREIVDEQNTLGPEAAAQISGTRSTAMTVGAAALAVGLALAFLIGRWIAGAVKRMAETMNRMAGGELEMAVAGDQHKHELGLMAKALKVFQENGLEKRRLDAEAKEAVERDRRAGEERAALQARVAEVVEKASAGDFASRVDARFEDETLNQFGQMMNGLLDTVSKGVDETVKVMDSLSRGDLDAEMSGAYQGAFAELQTNVNGTVRKLRQIVTDIQTASDQIKTATGEIATGAGDLSSRAENQAASLEEVAATMEEMSATVKKNAENAVSASNLSSDARERADKGGSVVSEAVTAMSRIEEGSGKIAEIVTVIDGFAFQTNLLALNAAVEAARAGEAGKGFAVVASEVRTLAQRSAEAARDIKGLIQESSHQVSDGVRLVTETGESLKEIVDAIRQVSATITEISEASREQSSGVDEITAAITSMDEITQQNSALADESASAARGLGDQAESLEKMMAFFTIGRSAAAWDADIAADGAAARYAAE